MQILLSFLYSQRNRIIIAFQKRYGYDVAIFYIHMDEYTYRDARDARTNITMLDSVRYFEPEGLRTAVFKKIIIGYLKYARDRG